MMLHASASEAHVLAVDDSLLDRKVIERLLKTTSCKVTAVDSGMRALEFLGLDADQRNSVVDDLKVDLIITDYCMPGMTGYDLLKRIKNSSTFKETPVVIMSSENIMPRIHRCLEEGAEDFILKPVTLSDVKRLKDYMSKEERSNGQEISRTNKRKEREGLDLPTQSTRSSPSVSSVFSSESQSPPSNSSSSSPTPTSPSGPLDSPTSPSSPSEPLDCPTPTLEPLECSNRRVEMSGSDEVTVGPTS